MAEVRSADRLLRHKDCLIHISYGLELSPAVLINEDEHRGVLRGFDHVFKLPVRRQRCFEFG